MDGPGLTFSALEDEPIKRVSSNGAFSTEYATLIVQIDYIFVNLPDSSVHISSSDVVIDENAWSVLIANWSCVALSFKRSNWNYFREVVLV